ncbi:MAG: T9SS type A sorting domain-containing protein [Bacteroidales bacterium]|nr:T9SS type A sorting domain-containing protein [Bacteroidales bacterium]
MKKTLVAIALMLSTMLAFGQNTAYIDKSLRSESFINKLIADSMHTSISMKIIMNGTVVQEQSERGITYYETEATYGNEIKSWSYSKAQNSDIYVKDDSVLTAYDKEGRKTQQTRYCRDQETNSWVLQAEEYYSYSGDTLITSSAEGLEEKEISYYRNGLRDSTIKYELDNGVWEKFSSKKYTYNAENNPILIVDYVYDKTSQSFKASMKSDYFYGVDKDQKNYCNFRFLFWDGNIWTDTINNPGYQLVQSMEATTYYKIKQVQQVVFNEVKTLESNNTVISLNPVTKEIYIYSDATTENALSIYNLNGNKMLFRQVEANESISVSALPEGIYLIILNNQYGTTKEKFSIK